MLPSSYPPLQDAFFNRLPEIMRLPQLQPFSTDDFVRARNLMDGYAHLGGFGIAGASNVVLAERHGTRNILTTDQRDFREIELSGGHYFRILPYDR